MERFFKLKERNTTVKTELIAGMTAFYASSRCRSAVWRVRRCCCVPCAGSENKKESLPIGQAFLFWELTIILIQMPPPFEIRGANLFRGVRFLDRGCNDLFLFCVNLKANSCVRKCILECF